VAGPEGQSGSSDESSYVKGVDIVVVDGGMKVW
jgi:hypothetical protein